MISSGSFEEGTVIAGGVRVLVVDDNEVNRKVLVAILAELGVMPRCAKTGYEAVELFLDMHPDLVLMDLHMPVVDGLEATRRIRELEKEFEWKRSWIVAVTADASCDIREACFAEGMNGFLLKPVRKVQVAEALHAAAERCHRHQQHA